MGGPPEREENVRSSRFGGSEAGAYLRIRDFAYHSTLGLRVKKKENIECFERQHQSGGAPGRHRFLPPTSSSLLLSSLELSDTQSI